jgi:peptidylamidoglycolate lyase
MSRFRRPVWYLFALVLVVSVLVFWVILRTVGWPLVNGRPLYTVVPNWPRLTNTLQLGQVTGVDVDSQGQLFVFARGEKVWDSETIDPFLIASPTIHVFNGSTGELLRSWGDNSFVMPHGLTVDQADNIWLTDVGLHQIYKFDSNGNLLLILGEAAVPGDDTAHFNRPTDVAVSADGSFYVSDGYLNSRIVKFDADGRYLFEWGSSGSATGEFDLPHSIALDGLGRVLVADRSNGRIQIFDENGHFLTEWRDGLRIGRPWAVRVDDAGFIYVVDGGDQNSWLPDRARVIKLSPEGEIIGLFGSYGDEPGQLIWPHSIAVGPDGAVYVAEVGSGRRVQKFLPRN